MGRFYSGDINGKFWFAVQSSNDADFFGGRHCEPSYIEYYFSGDDLPTIEKGIKECLKMLGKYKKKLDNFFKNCEGYTDEMIVKSLNINSNKVRGLLEWYARLDLGEKILKSVKNTGSCTFEAEQ